VAFSRAPSWRSIGFAGIILLASTFAGLGQDLTPTSFIQRSVAPAAVAKSEKVSASVQIITEYNSNVTLSDSAGSSQAPTVEINGNSNSGPKGDFVTNAGVSISGAWAPTRNSEFTLDLYIGYEEYVNHPNLDGLVTNLPSGLSYTIYTGDVKWTIHDAILVSNDPSQQPELSGIAKFGQITNTADLDASWAAGDRLTLTAGYERFDSIYSSSTSLTSSAPSNSTASSFFSLPNYSSNSFQLGMIYDLAQSMEFGFGGSVTDTSYQGNARNNTTSFSLGPFFNASLTPATKVFLTGGVETIDSTSASTDWYASFQLTNQLNRLYSHSLTLSHSVDLGLISDTYTLYSLDYSGAFQLRRGMTLADDLYVEYGTEGGGPIQENLIQYGASLTVQVQITRSVSGSVGWQFLDKLSNLPGRDYTQQRVFASLSWTF
jgi:hypothetical protein